MKLSIGESTADTQVSLVSRTVAAQFEQREQSSLPWGQSASDSWLVLVTLVRRQRLCVQAWLPGDHSDTRPGANEDTGLESNGVSLHTAKLPLADAQHDMTWQIYSSNTARRENYTAYTATMSRHTFYSWQQKVVWQLLGHVLLCPGSIPHWQTWEHGNIEKSDLLCMSQRAAEKWQNPMVLNDKTYLEALFKNLSLFIIKVTRLFAYQLTDCKHRKFSLRKKRVYCNSIFYKKLLQVIDNRISLLLS